MLKIKWLDFPSGPNDRPTWQTVCVLLFLQFYSPKNTIMFDDLRRNFVMNPQNGLTIRPFRKAHANRDSDQELVKLTQYLLAIAELDDVSSLNHKNWESYNEDNAKRRRHSWVTFAAAEISVVTLPPLKVCSFYYWFDYGADPQKLYCLGLLHRQDMAQVEE